MAIMLPFGRLEDPLDTNIQQVNGTTAASGNGAADAGTLRTTIATDSSVAQNLGILAGAVSGNEVQVDIVSMPAVSVTVSDLDIRNLTAALDTVVVTGGASQTADVKITLDSESVTVIGTITAELSATDNAVLDDIAANQTDASQKTQLVDGSGNVIGSTSNALDVNIKSGVSAEQFADGAVVNVLNKGTLTLGTDGSNYQVISTNATGHINIADGGNSITIDAPIATPVNVQLSDGFLTATVRNTGTADSLNVSIVDASGNQITTFGSSTVDVNSLPVGHNIIDSGTLTTITNVVHVDDNSSTLSVDDGAGSLTVDNSGTFAVQAVLGAETTKVIGTVNIASAQTIAVTQGTAASLNMTEASAAAIKTAVEIMDDWDDSDRCKVSGPDTDGGTPSNKLFPIAGKSHDGSKSYLPITDDPAAISITDKAIATFDKNANIVLGTIDEDTNAIKTALEIIDDWDETNRAAVNLIAGEAGVASGYGSTTANTPRVTLAYDDGVVISLAALDNAVDGNYLNTNLNIAGVDVDGNSGVKSAQTLRVVIATDQPALTNKLLVTEDSASAIKTAVELIDNSVDGNYLNVNCNIAGTDILGGAGAVAAGVQRTTLASDDPAVTSLGILDDWDESDRAKVNLIVGQAGIAAGAGAVGVTVPRITLCSDDPGVSSLLAIQGLVGAGADVGNDYQKVKKEETGVYAPGGTTGTAVDDSATNTILATTEVLTYPNFVLYIKNAGGGGANNIDSITVQCSPDGTLWIDYYASGTGLALVSGSGWFMEFFNNALRYIRVNALCTSGQTTTADSWITANKG